MIKLKNVERIFAFGCSFTKYYWPTWADVIASSELYGVNPTDVFETYLGTNKIIIDDGDGLTIDPDNLKVYSEVVWSTNVATPV